jgi:hypothetical protein
MFVKRIFGINIRRSSALCCLGEEELMIQDAVRKFSATEILPKVKEMDEAEKIDPEILKGLFSHGVQKEDNNQWFLANGN